MIAVLTFLGSAYAATTPQIAGLSPSSVNTGSVAFTLSVQGNNFNSHTTVRWNGGNRTTTYVNGSTLKASISASDVARAGYAKITVYNTWNGRTSNASTFTISAAGGVTVQPLSITTSALPSGAVGKSYAATLGASGGTVPYRWSLVSGSLPAGLALATSGAISGTSTTTGQSPFSVQVIDSAPSPQAATATMSIVVSPPALAITAASLPTVTVNTAYSASLAASGGTAPYSWTLASGQLPSGLSLSAAGTISGNTTVSGTFPFTVGVTDYTGTYATANLNLIVAAKSSTGYTRFYSPTSFWNTPIPATAAVDSNSSAMISTAITAYASNANFANTDAWGMALAFATTTSKSYTVACTMYCTGDTVIFPIPSGAQPTTGSDHHLAVVSGNQELDMWLASYNASSDTWSAGTRITGDVTGWGAACAQGQHCNGAVAAGFDLLGGAIRPEEIAQGHIDHALSITTPATRSGYIACPATHTDGTSSSSSAIPEGARIQLDPNFNVDAQSWSTWEKVIAKALQSYGAYVSDTGGSLAIRGVTDVNLGTTTWAWANTPKGPSLSNLPWSSFRVLQLQSCN
jgi:hypothetical protein